MTANSHQHDCFAKKHLSTADLAPIQLRKKRSTFAFDLAAVPSHCGHYDKSPERWMDGRTDGRTDGPTDGRTDKASYRVACPQLKTKKKKSSPNHVQFRPAITDPRVTEIRL